MARNRRDGCGLSRGNLHKEGPHLELPVAMGAPIAEFPPIRHRVDGRPCSCPRRTRAGLFDFHDSTGAGDGLLGLGATALVPLDVGCSVTKRHLASPFNHVAAVLRRAHQAITRTPTALSTAIASTNAAAPLRPRSPLTVPLRMPLAAGDSTSRRLDGVARGCPASERVSHPDPRRTANPACSIPGTRYGSHPGTKRGRVRQWLPVGVRSHRR